MNKTIPPINNNILMKKLDTLHNKNPNQDKGFQENVQNDCVKIT